MCVCVCVWTVKIKPVISLYSDAFGCCDSKQCRYHLLKGNVSFQLVEFVIIHNYITSETKNVCMSETILGICSLITGPSDLIDNRIVLSQDPSNYPMRNICLVNQSERSQGESLLGYLCVLVPLHQIK